MILPFQCLVSERRKTVIMSGHPLGLEIGFGRNSPSRGCKSRFAGIMNTRLGLRIISSVMSQAKSIRSLSC